MEFSRSKLADVAVLPELDLLVVPAVPLANDFFGNLQRDRELFVTSFLLSFCRAFCGEVNNET